MADRTFFEEVVQTAGNGDASSRLRAAGMVMEKCGDREIADAMRLLSSQLDFDDGIAATDAIRHSRKRLDKMIAARKARHAMQYAKLMTDDEVRALSSGEVTDGDYSFLESRYCRGGLFDPDIFGGSGSIPAYLEKEDRIPSADFGSAMGHVELPCRVLPEAYLHIAAGLLSMEEDDVRKVTHYACYLVLAPGTSGLPMHAVLNEKEYAEHAGDEGFLAKTGADAVHEALSALNYPDCPERIAFQTVSVVSPAFRPLAYSAARTRYYVHPLTTAYNRVVNARRRIMKLMELGAPDIILRNEKRMLNDAVDMLYDSVGEYRRRIYTKGRGRNGFLFAQLSAAVRDRCLALEKPVSEKSSEIESLGIYPEAIQARQENGSLAPVPLADVMDACQAAKSSYASSHAVVLPDGADPDADIPDEVQAEMDEAAKNYGMLEEKEDLILAGASKERESFVVAWNAEWNTYFPEKEG